MRMNSQGTELVGNLLDCHTTLELEIRVFGSPLRSSVVDCDRSKLLRHRTVLYPLTNRRLQPLGIFPETASPGVTRTVYHHGELQLPRAEIAMRRFET